MDNPITPAPPIPPPVPPAPNMAPSPGSPPPPPTAGSVTAVPRKRSPVLLIIFLLLGLAALVVLAITTGLASRFVPGLSQTTLTYWGLWEPETVMRPILDEFEKTHPNIKVDYKMQSPQEYRERLQSALSQTGPDIFRIHNTWLPMFKGEAAPVPSSVMSPADFAKTFSPAAVSDLRSGSDFLGIPLEYDGIAMFINDAILAQHGLSAPQNWEDLRNTALAVTECATDDGTCKDNSKILVSGAALGSAENVDHWQDILSVLMLQNNVNLNQLDSPSTKAADDVFEYYNSFYQPLGIWNPNLPNSTSFFASGKLAIYFAPSWRVFDIAALNPNLKYSVHPLPQLPVDPSRNEAPISYASYWVEIVNKRSPQTKAAWELLAYLSSPDVLKKFQDQAIASGRQFGEPYSRLDLVDSLPEPAKTFASQAKISRSWYLASFTHDGDSGINSRLSASFAKAVKRIFTASALAKEVNGVLSQYGLASPVSAR